MKKIFFSIAIVTALVVSTAALNGCNSSSSTPQKFTITGSGQ